MQMFCLAHGSQRPTIYVPPLQQETTKNAEFIQHLLEGHDIQRTCKAHKDCFSFWKPLNHRGICGSSVSKVARLYADFTTHTHTHTHTHTRVTCLSSCHNLSRSSSVSIMIRLRAGRLGFNFRRGQRWGLFLFATACR
jgi:hypothetical protein